MKTRGEIIVATADAALLKLLSDALAGDARVVAAETKPSALLAARSASAELALLDARLSPPIEFLQKLRRVNPALGFVLMLGVDEEELAVEAARAAAYDVLIRPMEPAHARFRIRVALEKHSRALEERAYRVALEERLNNRTEEVMHSRDRIKTQFVNTIRALEKALQAKNVYTEGHSRRVAEKAVEVARAMGVARDLTRHIELGALFHDIGKIGIRDEVLNKAGKLTESEYEHIKTHPLVAEQILSPIEELRPIVDIVKYEHERWDGGGYPAGLKGEAIPLGARLIAIADAWDSMVFDRVYRKALSHEAALAELEKHAGTQFDPTCVAAFCRLERERLSSPTTRRMLPGS
ncbi:MAG TPA: HD-GYP domain-containing protein [Planctomycetota bacterium]